MSRDTKRRRLEWDPDNGDLVLHVSEMVELLPEDAKRALVRSEIIHGDVIEAVADAAVRGGEHAYLWLQEDRRWSEWMGGRHLGRKVREKLLPLMDRAAYLLVGLLREDAAEKRRERDEWRRHAKWIRREFLDQDERSAAREREPGYTHLRYGEDEGEEAVEKMRRAIDGGVPYFCPRCGNRDLAPPGESPTCSSSPSCGERMVEVLMPDPHGIPVLEVKFKLRGLEGPTRSTRMRCPTDSGVVEKRLKALWGRYPEGVRVRCLGPDVRHSTRVREMLGSRVMAEARGRQEPVVGTLVVAEPRRHEFRCEIEGDDGDRQAVHVSRVRSIEEGS